jgi:integral membrane sensor domain MASE1
MATDRHRSCSGAAFLDFASGPLFFRAFIANITTNTPLLTSIGIASGNTLEALTAAWLLQRFVGFDRSLHRFRDIFGLIFCGRNRQHAR